VTFESQAQQTTSAFASRTSRNRNDQLFDGKLRSTTATAGQPRGNVCTQISRTRSFDERHSRDSAAHRGDSAAQAKHLPNSATCPTELGNTMPLRRQAEEYHRNRGPAPWKRLRPNLPNTKLRRRVCMPVPTLADARAERAAIAAALCHVSPMLLGRQNGEGQRRGTPAIQPLTAEIQLPTAEN